MDTNRLKRFATEARNILIGGVVQRLAALGFLPDGTVTEKPELMDGGAVFMGEVQAEDFYHQWMSLQVQVQRRSFREVAEEAAYTWFNRLVAIRIMVKNELVPAVLEYESDEVRIPVIVTEARQGRLPQMDEAQHQKLDTLLQNDALTDKQFALLIVAYCHSNPIIQKCFGSISDYTELLLPGNILKSGGFIDRLNADDYITDADYRSPELIGWLYQFYISERKDEVFAKKGKFEADEIPTATQIFTPDWIVKYMVQNTVGRIYLDNNPYSGIKEGMKFLVEPDEPTPANNICQFDDICDLKVADLACGSGHILNECFDLLYQIYMEEGYNRKQAVENIFRYNLTGVDIDARARQLATFALLMKACQKDKSFTDGHCMSKVISVPPRLEMDDEELAQACLDFVGGYENVVAEWLEGYVEQIRDADSLGSIIKFDMDAKERAFFQAKYEDWAQDGEDADDIPKAVKQLMPYMKFILTLTEQYDALAMNPPYMGGGNMNSVLSRYVKDNYEDSKADLATVFVEMMGNRMKPNGRYAFIIPPSWMFLSTFENLRKNIIDNQTIESLLHLSRGVFGADFGASSAVIANTKNPDARGTYFRLIERTFQEFDQKHLKMLFEKTLANHGFRYFFADYSKDMEDIVYSENGSKIYYPNVPQKNFKKIPGCPIGYWLNNNYLSLLQEETLNVQYKPKAGLSTADNDRFLRYWEEVSLSKIYFEGHNRNDLKDFLGKWVPTTKGGTYRKWYGNNSYVLNFENDGEELKYWLVNNPKDPTTKSYSRYIRNYDSYLQHGISFSDVASGNPHFRWQYDGFIPNSRGPYIYTNNFVVLAYVNSVIEKKILELLCPSMTFNVGDIGKLPFRNIEDKKIVRSVSQNISISKQDWDAHETSWDFLQNELISLIGQSDEKLGDAEALIALCSDTAQPYAASLQQKYSNTAKVIQQRCKGDAATLQSRCNNTAKSVQQYRNDGAAILQSRCSNTVVTVQQHCNGGAVKGTSCISSESVKLSDLIDKYHRKWEALFMRLHANEEELNRQFIDIYGLQDELTPNVPLSEITILQQGEISIENEQIVWHDDVIIKQLISYAVGCMMGRYSIDRPGLILANQGDGKAEYEALVPNSRFAIDDDGIIPLMSVNNELTDHITLRFKTWLGIAFGEDTLMENLNFAEQALGKRLEDYFQKDSWKEHKKMYQNRPIYWLFSSKKGAFQCIVYMHRMNAYTAEKVRTGYLLPHIEWLMARQQELQDNAANLSARERKEMDNIGKQITECREYHDRLHVAADQQIAFDLDDGVVVNYAKFGDVLAKLK